MRCFYSVFIAYYFVIYKATTGVSAKTYNDEADVFSPTLTVSSRILDTPGPCQREISAVGNGVLDKFIKPCTQTVAYSVNSYGVMVFGDPNKVPFSLFSEKRATLIVVKNKVCTRKTYKTKKGITRNTRSAISKRKCSQIKNRMSNTLQSVYNNVPQLVSKPIEQATAPENVLTQLPETPVVPATPVLPNVVQMESYPMNPQSTQDLSLPEPSNPPTPVSTLTDNVAFVQSTNSPTITYLPADSRVNNPYFTRTNNVYSNDGHYVQELIIVGRGINDRFKYPSATNNPPKCINFGNVLILTDPDGYFKLVTTKWGVLWELVNDQYYERTYETDNGQTKITSTPITAAEYQAAKENSSNQSGGEKVSNFGNTYIM